MRYRALDVFLGPNKLLVGRLFQYGTGSGAITRLNPEKGFWADDNAPVLSQNALMNYSTLCVAKDGVSRGG